MIFHLGFELPKKETVVLDPASTELTTGEAAILKKQIRKNSTLIDVYVGRLDLLVNTEGYPRRAAFIHKIRRRLELLMEENDTFRKVYWKYFQSRDIMDPGHSSLHGI